MVLHLHMTKMSGAGNDFVVLGDPSGTLDLARAPLARALCDRHHGVGADGLLILRPSAVADFAMEYYNADGSTGGMCGNGGRCLARYALRTGVASRRMRFEAFGHLYAAEETPAGMRLSMRDPGVLEIALPLDGVEGRPRADVIDTGAPHAVVVVDDVDAVDVERLGRAIRADAAFGREGTNADFLARTADGSYQVRTYERGVEAETLACGTGSVAAAVSAALHFDAPSPVNLRVRSREVLTVGFERRGERGFTNVTLEGSARVVFDGECSYDEGAGVLIDHVPTPHHPPTGAIS
jgi:diaminopimelate epimerase